MFFLYGAEILLTTIVVILGLVLLYKFTVRYFTKLNNSSERYPLTGDSSGILWSVNNTECNTKIYIDNYDIDIQIVKGSDFYSVYMNDVCIKIKSSSLEDVQKKALAYIHDEYHREPRSQFSNDLLFSKMRA